MDVRRFEAGQDKKWKNKRDTEGGGNHKESPGMGMWWEERCTTYYVVHRKEGDGNESTGEKEERKT